MSDALEFNNISATDSAKDPNATLKTSQIEYINIFTPIPKYEDSGTSPSPLELTEKNKKKTVIFLSYPQSEDNFDSSDDISHKVIADKNSIKGIRKKLKNQILKVPRKRMLSGDQINHNYKKESDSIYGGNFFGLDENNSDNDGDDEYHESDEFVLDTKEQGNEERYSSDSDEELGILKILKKNTMEIQQNWKHTL